MSAALNTTLDTLVLWTHSDGMDNSTSLGASTMWPRHFSCILHPDSNLYRVYRNCVQVLYIEFKVPDKCYLPAIRSIQVLKYYIFIITNSEQSWGDADLCSIRWYTLPGNSSHAWSQWTGSTVGQTPRTPSLAHHVDHASSSTWGVLIYPPI